MPLVVFLAFLAAGIKDATYSLRSGCSTNDAVVAELRRGDDVQIRFAVTGDSGPCYKVSTPKGDGYLPASALTSTEDFEQARQAGALLEVQIQKIVKAEALDSLKAAGTDNPLVAAVRLLDSGHPDQAYDVLQPALRENRKDPQALALAGLAAYRSDKVKQAAWHWKESLDLRPNNAIQQMYDKALKELAADQSGERKVGGRFELRYDGQAVSEDAARQMVEALEQEYARITAELGCRWGERIAAIVQTREAYLKSSDAAVWSGGSYDGRIRIALFENGVGPRTRRVFAHEITHACLASLGTWPLWLHEGLAQKMAGEALTPAAQQQVRAALLSGQIPRIDRLTPEWLMLSPAHAARAYGLALAAVETLYEDYPDAGIRNLLNNPEALPQVVAHLNQRLLQ